MDKSNIKDIYGLSSMQNSIIVNCTLNEDSTAYVEQFSFEIVGSINSECMKTALWKLSEKYDTLRTVFSYGKTDVPRQIVLKEWKPDLLIKDFRGEKNIIELVENYKKVDRERGFKLNSDVLVRATLIQIEQEVWKFIFTFHHIILDGWSLGPLFMSLFSFYEEASQGQVNNVIKEEHSYNEYIKWLDNKDGREAELYWENYLLDYDKPAMLPEYTKTKDYTHMTYKFALSSELTNKLEKMAKENNLTLNTIIQATWGILLQRLNFVEDVVYGNIVSGRPPSIPGIEEMVGLFINTQPIRVKAYKGETFIEICKNVQKDIFSASDYEYYPLYEIQSHCELKNQLINHVLAFENYPLQDQISNLSGNSKTKIKFKDIDVYEQTNYDFNVVVNPGERLQVTFLYNSEKYIEETIQVLERSLSKIFDMVGENGFILIEDIKICSEIDKAKIINEFQGKKVDYPCNETVDQLFVKAASKYSEKIAIIYGEDSYTYKELDQWSDCIANRLFEMGVTNGTGVGLYVKRSPEMIAGMIAILKVGAYYVPIDVSFSIERTEFITQDTGVKIVCTHSDIDNRLPSNVDKLFIDRMNISEDSVKWCNDNGPMTVSHIMYTSGSTGKPKGCYITHRNIISLVFGQDVLPYSEEQIFLQTGSPAYDASTYEIWGRLLYGSTMILVNDDTLLDGHKLEEVIIKNKVNITFISTSLLHQLCDSNPNLFCQLDYLITGGDVLSVKHIKKIMQLFPKLKIINAYGPTENTTMSTVYTIQEEDIDKDRISIGKPIANSTAYIGDKYYNVLPQIGIGELYVGGPGVSLGYHKRIDLTTEKFIEDSFVKDEKMYCTGDLVRWAQDGNIDFLGRFDSQVKIRGFRVELSEIENVIKNHGDINDAVIILKQNENEKQLYGYYCSTKLLEPIELRTWLQNQLPKYMIPEFLIQIESIPLTNSAKVDKKKLLEIKADFVAHYEINEVKTDVQQIVADIVCEILDTDQVSIYDNLFDIGVNSLNLISINNRLERILDKEIPLTVFFSYTTIEKISKFLEMNEVSEEIIEENQDSIDMDLVLKNSNMLKTNLLNEGD